MKPGKWRTALVLLVSFCFLATSCTTTRVIPVPSGQMPSTQDVKIRKTVRVTLNSGEVKLFKVKVIDADALAGTEIHAPYKEIRVPYTDMRFLEVKDVSGLRSVGLGLGVVLALAGALFVALLSNIDGGE